MKLYSDEYYMKKALQEAELANQHGEIPVGAVIVFNNQIVAKTHNQTQLLNDVTAHAEMLAITAAANYLGSKYLSDCTLYVTLEPCQMCAGALFWSQIGRVVYSAEDTKHGFMREHGRKVLHPKTKLEFGLLQEYSSAILTNFFKSKR